MVTMDRVLINQVRALGSAAAKRGSEPRPSDDWAMLKHWEAEKAPIDPEFNRHLYDAWLEGYNAQMKLLVECRHCSKRVKPEKSNISAGYCDVCYVRHYASDDKIESFVQVYLDSQQKGE